MFICRFSVLLTEGKTAIELRRNINLPFVPHAGLEITGVADGPVVVSFVAWDERRGEFEIDLVDEEAEGISLADLVKSYGPEWEVARNGD